MLMRTLKSLSWRAAVVATKKRGENVLTFALLRLNKSFTEMKIYWKKLATWKPPTTNTRAMCTWWRRNQPWEQQMTWKPSLEPRPKENEDKFVSFSLSTTQTIENSSDRKSENSKIQLTVRVQSNFFSNHFCTDIRHLGSRHSICRGTNLWTNQRAWNFEFDLLCKNRKRRLRASGTERNLTKCFVLVKWIGDKVRF